MNPPEFPCQVCHEAEAEIIDSEQGAICFACHDHLVDADNALGSVCFRISTTTNPHKHEQ